MTFRVATMAAVLIALAAQVAPVYAKPPLNLAIMRQQSRNGYTRFESLVGALGIAEGMTVLDIGSGPGYASFLIAEKLHGTGLVVATDIRRDFVEYVAAEARERKLPNLVSYVVKAEGFDDIYRKHRYDLVLLSNVYHCLDDRVAYFRSLRPLLNPHARLALVLYNQVPLFSPDDFPDVDGIVDRLKADGEGGPFYRRLSGKTRELIGKEAGREGIESALAEDFNRMLGDPALYREFYEDSYFRKGLFSDSERELANWLLMTIREEGVLEKPAGQVDARAMRTVAKLNRLFIRTRFGDLLAEDGAGAYVPAGDANRQTSKYVALRELESAGYRLEKEIRLSPFYDALIMAPR
jgi:SAM-dependent methyltransferase